MARIEQQVGVGVEQPCPCAGGGNQSPQDGRHALGIDREIQILVARNRRDALASLQLKQFLRIDGDRIGVDRCRGGDRPGDDFTLGKQAFHAGIDQPLAELVKIHDAADQHDDGREVEEHDPPRQAGKEGVPEDAADNREGMYQEATRFCQAFQFI